MASQPERPGEESELDAETRAILDDRLETIEEDRRHSVNWRQSMAEIRRDLKTLAHN